MIGVAVTVVALLGSSVVRGEVPCAGDGPPLYAGDNGAMPPLRAPSELVATALVTTSIGIVGQDVAGGSGMRLERARFGFCGRAGEFAFRLIWEPFSIEERAHVDHSSREWGRLSDAAIGWAPFRWLVVTAGEQRVPSGRGREQPVGALALPLLPYTTIALMPDRRLGASIDGDLGALRLYAGAFASARTIDMLSRNTGAEGLLAVARITITPIGPLGARALPDAGAWTDRPRLRLGITVEYDSHTGGVLAETDAAFAVGRVHLAGEVAFVRSWRGEAGNRYFYDDALGTWLEAVVKLSDTIAAVARVEERWDYGTSGFSALSSGMTIALPGPYVVLSAMATHVVRIEELRSTDEDLALVALTVER